MLLNRARVLAIAIVTVVHAVLSIVLWLWMAGVTGLGFKERATWSALEQAQAGVVPVVAQVLTLPGRLLLPDITNELGLVALLVANSVLWGVVLVALYVLLRSRREQHKS